MLANPALSIVKTGVWVDGNSDGYADVGEAINYTFSVKNEGNLTLTNVTVVDTVGGVTISGGPTTLDVGETDTTTFTAVYFITQADIDAGHFFNTATADSDESEPASDDENVTLPAPVTPQAIFSVVKFYDVNANGVMDAGEPQLNNWRFTINGEPYSTPIGANLNAGTYYILELRPNENCWIATTATSVTLELEDGDDETIYFGNVCLGPGGGKTLGFWSNKNGQALFGSEDLATMVALNLRNANGTHFDPANYSTFRAWLVRAKATNMAYMLSAQLAAMKLNVLNGFVDGSALVYAPGTTSANPIGFATVNNLMAEANAELGLHGLTLAGGPYRGYQEALKNALHRANNNRTFVQPIPCGYTFP
jgi:uncharacterized repeat protein (TIGR01451 family)